MGRSQEGIDLRLVEIGHGGLRGLLERDRADLGTPGEVFRAVQADILGERMKGAEALIARPTTTASIFLQMLEEPTEHERRQILDGQSIDRCLGRGAQEGQQQGERVAVAGLGVARQIALGDEVFQEKPPNPGPDQPSVTHGKPAAGRTVRSAGWLHARARASW